MPLMMVMMLLILGAGVLVFWLGFSTSGAAQAQTAADAAALAAEQNAVQQLEGPVQGTPTGTIVPTTPDWTQACRAADHYATLNQAHVLACQAIPASTSTIGFDVKVQVAANSTIPSGKPDAGGAATAWARASTDPFSQASPPIKTTTTSSCDASVVAGPTFSPHSGQYGFFPSAGANYGQGCEPKLAGALDQLAVAKHLRLDGAAGYVATDKANASDPAAVAHGCGDASTTPGLASVPNAVLSQFGLTRPYPKHPAVVELAGVSCQQTSTDAGAGGPVGLGNLNVHLVPLGGGPEGSLFSLVGGGASSIGETPLQVGCQIYRVWQHLPLGSIPGNPQKVLLITLMVAQDESSMGQNIGSNRTDPNQSVGVFQQISADGWGTIPEELNVTTAAEMFLFGGHIGGRASTRGLLGYYQADPSAPTWALAQATQVSGAGQSSDGANNYGAASNVAAAQAILGQVTSGQCRAAG